MSRKLRITEEDTTQYVANLLKILQALKPTTDKFTYTGSFQSDDRRAKLVFTPMAWNKMNLLVNGFDKEVAWHGVVERDPDETKDEYIVSDILVYPQSTNGTYVDMDEDRYSEWITANMDAPWQGKLHLQGHSHVGMPTSPSGTDMTHQEEVLATTRKDGFKIFVIWNKRGENHSYIYDYKKNVTFGPKEIDVEVRDTDFDVEAFMKEAREMVKSYTYTAKPAAKTASGVPGSYGGSYGSGYGYYNGGNWSGDDDDDDDWQYSGSQYGGTYKPVSAAAPKTAESTKPAAQAGTAAKSTDKPAVISLADRQKVVLN